MPRLEGLRGLTRLALLERHAGGETAASPGGRAFVVLIVAGVLAMATAPLLVPSWLGRALV